MALIGTPEVNRITGLIIKAAITVHRALGPGLLESAYSACLVHEMRDLGLSVESDVRLPLNYKGIHLDKGYKLDLRANGCVIVELKCVKKLAPIHDAQVITYLRLTGCPMGLLLNFNVRLLKHGIKRLAHPDLIAESAGYPQREGPAPKGSSGKSDLR
jgi:GxxExxY protein